MNSPKYLITCPQTGICRVNVKLLAKRWGKTFRLIQRGREYALKNRNIKVSISASNARYLIEKLSLTETKSSIFKDGSVWEI